MTPSGEQYHGFKVTIADGLPEVKRDYVKETVSQILHKDSRNFKVTEEHHADGTFKSFSVLTPQR